MQTEDPTLVTPQSWSLPVTALTGHVTNFEKFPCVVALVCAPTLGTAARMAFAGEAWKILVSIVAPTAFGNALEYLPVTFGLSMVGHQPGLSEAQINLEVDAMVLARFWGDLPSLRSLGGGLA